MQFVTIVNYLRGIVVCCVLGTIFIVAVIATTISIYNHQPNSRIVDTWNYDGDSHTAWSVSESVLVDRYSLSTNFIMRLPRLTQRPSTPSPKALSDTDMLCIDTLPRNALLRHLAPELRPDKMFPGRAYEVLVVKVPFQTISVSNRILPPGNLTPPLVLEKTQINISWSRFAACSAIAAIAVAFFCTVHGWDFGVGAL
jgi:hypothetical protein